MVVRCFAVQTLPAPAAAAGGALATPWVPADLAVCRRIAPSLLHLRLVVAGCAEEALFQAGRRPTSGSRSGRSSFQPSLVALVVLSGFVVVAEAEQWLRRLHRQRRR